MASDTNSFAAVRSKAEHKEMLAKATKKTVIVITVG
jgi:hypothetical protein